MTRKELEQAAWDYLEQELRGLVRDFTELTERTARLLAEDSVRERICEPEHRQAQRLKKEMRP